MAESKEKIVLSKYNTCHIAGLGQAIKQSVAIDWPLLVLGSFGVGKSALVNAWSEENGYATVDVRVSQLLPEDVGGLPFADPKKEQVVRLMPDIISKCWAVHEETGKPVLLFMDEFTSGVPSIMAACYQVVLDRCAAGFELPPGTRIIAAGNTAKDRGVVFEMPRPMANRMMIVEFNGPTWPEFEEYGFKTGIHPAVMTFLRQQPEYLCGKVNVDDEEGRNPTPRSWAAVSRMLHSADKTKIALPDRMFLASSCVGDHSALQFEATLRLQDKLVSFEEVLQDPKNAPVYPKDLAASYMQLTMMISRLEKPEQFSKVLEYVERMPRELIGVFLKSLLYVKPKLILTRREVVVKYREFCSAGNALAA